MIWAIYSPVHQRAEDRGFASTGPVAEQGRFTPERKMVVVRLLFPVAASARISVPVSVAAADATQCTELAAPETQPTISAVPPGQCRGLTSEGNVWWAAHALSPETNVLVRSGQTTGR